MRWLLCEAHLFYEINCHVSGGHHLPACPFTKLSNQSGDRFHRPHFFIKAGVLSEYMEVVDDLPRGSEEPFRFLPVVL
jgi:hypothetical protein